MWTVNNEKIHLYGIQGLSRKGDMFQQASDRGMQTVVVNRRQPKKGTFGFRIVTVLHELPMYVEKLQVLSTVYNPQVRR